MKQDYSWFGATALFVFIYWEILLGNTLLKNKKTPQEVPYALHANALYKSYFAKK